MKKIISNIVLSATFAVCANATDPSDKLPAIVIDTLYEASGALRVEYEVIRPLEHISLNVNSLFIQSAYACDCEDAGYYLKERVTSIQVFSEKDFDETHPTSTDIAEFFKVYKGSGILTSFESYVKYLEPTFYTIIDLQFRCVLTANVFETGEYEFTFVVGLSDGRELKQSIKAVLE